MGRYYPPTKKEGGPAFGVAKIFTSFNDASVQSSN